MSEITQSNEAPIQFKPNLTKTALRQGEVVAVPEINRVFSPIIVELIGQLGYRCV